MNRRLARAVLEIFQEKDRDSHYASISAFKLQDWVNSYKWLDASGLALYFVARIKSLRVENAIPAKTLVRLEQNLADNRDRTADMFGEFVRINELFTGEKIPYVNLKGFTLAPGIGSDIALRRQFDLDFAVSCRDVLRCESLLKQHGYWLTGIGKNVLEFKTGSGKLPLLRDLYKAGSQRSLEIHFSDQKNRNEVGSYEALIERARRININGIEVPVVQESDSFLALASHLFKHLKSEWTRVSWVLEYAIYIKFHIDNEQLWSDVCLKIENNNEKLNAVGASTLLACMAFNLSHLPKALSSAIDKLPVFIRLWIDRYGERVFFAEFPGSKLYLLLSTNNESEKSNKSISKTVFHLPPRVSYSKSNESSNEKLERCLSEIKYLFMRLRFHVGEGMRYAFEAQRWKRYITARSI